MRSVPVPGMGGKGRRDWTRGPLDGGGCSGVKYGVLLIYSKSIVFFVLLKKLEFQKNILFFLKK